MSDNVYQRLKGLAEDNYRTIGGQIEFMMDNQASHPVPAKELLRAKEYKPGDLYDPLHPPKKSEATPRVDDLFASPRELVDNLPDNMQVEKPCCANELQPCKHWVWDVSTGEGYKNSLSGRFMEVE